MSNMTLGQICEQAFYDAINRRGCLNAEAWEVAADTVRVMAIKKELDDIVRSVSDLELEE
jgi:hypothetical protein